ncbi:MAG: dihydrofolate reductase [Saprospiraceae bacterium]|nr:dihydrofolate reductase [Saprospiraceae bacterium]
MDIILIAALSENKVIGDGKNILWSLPDDEIHFTQTIKHEWVVTGRVSYESTQGINILHRRSKLIILTSNPEFTISPGWVAKGIDNASRIAHEQGAQKLFVLGGASVYRACLPYATAMVLTHVHTRIQGTSFYPNFSQDEWCITKEQYHSKDKQHKYAFTISWYSRKDHGTEIKLLNPKI